MAPKHGSLNERPTMYNRGMVNPKRPLSSSLPSASMADTANPK